MFFCVSAAVFLSPQKKHKETRHANAIGKYLIHWVFLPRSRASVSVMPSYRSVFSALPLKILINTFFPDMKSPEICIIPDLVHQPFLSWQIKTMSSKTVFSLEMK